MTCTKAQRYGSVRHMEEWSTGCWEIQQPCLLPMHLLNQHLCQGIGTECAGLNKPDGISAFREFMMGTEDNIQCLRFSLDFIEMKAFLRSWLIQSLKEQF